MWPTAYSLADPPRIKNELPEARVSVLKDLESPAVRS